MLEMCRKLKQNVKQLSKEMNSCLNPKNNCYLIMKAMSEIKYLRIVSHATCTMQTLHECKHSFLCMGKYDN